MIARAKALELPTSYVPVPGDRMERFSVWAEPASSAVTGERCGKQRRSAISFTRYRICRVTLIGKPCRVHASARADVGDPSRIRRNQMGDVTELLDGRDILVPRYQRSRVLRIACKS
jgi:hypothetical protein